MQILPSKIPRRKIIRYKICEVEFRGVNFKAANARREICSSIRQTSPRLAAPNYQMKRTHHFKIRYDLARRFAKFRAVSK